MRKIFVLEDLKMCGSAEMIGYSIAFNLFVYLFYDCDSFFLVSSAFSCLVFSYWTGCALLMMINGLQLCRDIGILLKFAEFLSEPLLWSCRSNQKIVRLLNLMSMILIIRRVINQRNKRQGKNKGGKSSGPGKSSGDGMNR